MNTQIQELSEIPFIHIFGVICLLIGGYGFSDYWQSTNPESNTYRLSSSAALIICGCILIFYIK